MGSLKKFDGSSWINSNLRKLTTDTDTFTTFPAIIYAEGTNATVSLKGNTVQSSTPTPDSPVMPQGTGERTGNLVRFYQEEMQGRFYGVDVTVKNAEITLNGTVTTGLGHWIEIGYKFDSGTASTDNVVIPCKPETPYTIATEILDGNSSQVRLISFGTSIENRTVNIGSSSTTTFSGDINRIFISLGAEGVVFNNLKFRVMFNKGSAPLPYEPYGYKIPISSASTTTPVYLGEVETTRRIKKLVLTGEEAWSSYSGVVYLSNVIDYLKTDAAIAVCTHYQSQTSVESVNETTAGHIAFSKGSNSRLCIRDNNYTSATNFKTYLQQQYANGTPVTVWYVLATEETAVVNEPLMRIGDYADTVSGISIPATSGGDTLSVGTTVQPSEVTANYYGWHTITAHERESGQWD